MLYFSLVLESVGRTESSFVNKLWHQLEPRGELGTETEVWEGRHTRGGGLVPEHKPRHTSRRISAREKMLSELRRGGGACVVPLGRDQRRPEGGGGCTVPGGGGRAGEGIHRGPVHQSIYLSVSFPQTSVQGEVLVLNTRPTPYSFFPAPVPHLLGWHLKLPWVSSQHTEGQPVPSCLPKTRVMWGKNEEVLTFSTRGG